MAATPVPPSNPSKSRCKVAVIGAGAAGLVTARELVWEGHSVTVFEQAARPGGIWVYSDETDSDPLGKDENRKRVHGSLYTGLTTNLPRQVMSFSDLPFSPAVMGPKYSIDSRTYPRHEEVLNYLLAFIDRYNLSSLVRYSTRVVRVAPAPAPKASKAQAPAPDRSPASWHRQWVVESVSAAPEDQAGAHKGCKVAIVKETFDAVMVANGHFSEPHLPHVAGSDVFPGLQLHSHNYRRPDPFAGKKVAVVGSSFSALDIVKHIAPVADRVYICARQWKTQWDLGSPYGPRKNIERRGMISRLTTEGGAQFAVGQSVQRLDAVVYCTGFEYCFPFLDLEVLGLSTAQQHVEPLYQHLFSPAFGPGLAFIGLPFRASAFPMFELQGKLCARLLSGRATLPPPAGMEDWISRTKQQLVAEGLGPSDTHRFDHRQLTHHAWLASTCGPDVVLVPNWRMALLYVYWVAYWVVFQVGQWRRALCMRRKAKHA